MEKQINFLSYPSKTALTEHEEEPHVFSRLFLPVCHPVQIVDLE